MSEVKSKSAPDYEKSDGELSDGELSEEGQISDEGEISEQDTPESLQSESPLVSKDTDKSSRFDKFRVWQEAMANNVKSAYSKIGPETIETSSDESSESEDENPAFMMVNSESYFSFRFSHHSHIIHIFCCYSCFVLYINILYFADKELSIRAICTFILYVYIRTSLTMDLNLRSM